MTSTTSRQQPWRFLRRRVCRWIWRGMRIFWVGIVWAVVLGCIPSLLFFTSDMVGKVIVWNWIVAHMFLIIGIIAGGGALTIISWIGGRQSVSSEVVALTSDERSRLGILNTLRKAYTDALAASLQGAARIEIGLHERFDLTYPARLATWQPGQEERALPVGTSIVTAYHSAGRGLFILGVPGAGKTTLLYDLAQQLLEETERDEKALLPIVLNLSSWALKHQSLHEWVAKELELRYFIPRRLGQRWIQEERFLLLLDGLDEVAPSAYGACIETINSYYAANLLPLVVCSRQEEYMRQAQRLTLQSAMIIQPLSMALVKAHLAKIGRPVAALRQVIRTNVVLQELLTTPLMLSIVVLAYYGRTVKDLPRMGTPEEQQREVFAMYLQRRLHDSSRPFLYAPEQMRCWLVWLASHMQQRNQSLLYLEQLQPDLLPQGWPQRCYLWIGVHFPHIVMGMSLGVVLASFLFQYRLANILYTGVYGGVIAGLLSHRYLSGVLTNLPRKAQHGLPFLRQASLLGMACSVVVVAGDWFISPHATSTMYVHDGLIFGVWMLILTLLILGETPSFLPIRSSLQMGGNQKLPSRSLLTNVLLKSLLLKTGCMALISGLSVGLSAGLGDGLSYGLSYGLANGLSFGLIFGLIFIVLIFLVANGSASIILTEMLIWSWKRLRQAFIRSAHMRNALLVSGLAVFVIGLSYGLSYGLSVGLSYGLVWGFCIGVVYWLFIGLLQSISSDQFQPHQRVLPNQGIWRSGFNSLLLGCVGGLIAMVTGGISIGLSDGLSYGLSVGLSYGLSAGLSAGLSYGLSYGLGDGLSYGLWFGLATGLFVIILQGGSAWWRHWILRILLWRTGLQPFRLVRFLNAAASRALLYKVGGGYRFVHDLFRDSLISLHPPVSRP